MTCTWQMFIFSCVFHLKPDTRKHVCARIHTHLNFQLPSPCHCTPFPPSFNNHLPPLPYLPFTFSAPLTLFWQRLPWLPRRQIQCNPVLHLLASPRPLRHVFPLKAPIFFSYLRPYFLLFLFLTQSPWLFPLLIIP